MGKKFGKIASSEDDKIGTEAKAVREHLEKNFKEYVPTVRPNRRSKKVHVSLKPLVQDELPEALMHFLYMRGYVHRREKTAKKYFVKTWVMKDGTLVPESQPQANPPEKLA